MNSDAAGPEEHAVDSTQKDELSTPVPDLATAKAALDRALFFRAGRAEDEPEGVALTPPPAQRSRMQEMIPLRQLSKEHLIGLLRLAEQPPATWWPVGIQIGWANGSNTYVRSAADLEQLFELDKVASIGVWHRFPDESSLHLMLLRGVLMLSTGPEGTQSRHRYGALKSYLDTADIPTARVWTRIPWLLIPAVACFAIGIYYWFAKSDSTATIYWNGAAILFELADLALGKRWKAKPDDGQWLVQRYPVARLRFWRSQLFWSVVSTIVGVLTLVVTVIAVLVQLAAT